MIDQKAFMERSGALFGTVRDRYKKVLQKQAKRQKLPFTIDSKDILPFTLFEFRQWLAGSVGLGIVPCMFCQTPIDIINLSVDHRTPLRRGGGPELANLQICCKRCNEIKGDFTWQEFALIVQFMNGPAIHFRARLEGVLKNGHVGNMLRNFPRKQAGAVKALPQPALEFYEDDF